MKKNKLKIIFPIIIILLSFAFGIYFYPSLPQTMVTHWGINGEANGFSSKNFGVFFMPILSIFLLILFLVLPKTDPYKKNFAEYKKYFENFINIIIFFLFYIYVISLVWNLGYRFDLIQFITPGFVLIFYYAGILMEHAKRNWFVGIRTPWTISNETVWEKTHQLGAKLFKSVALISLLGIALPQYSIFLFLIPILLVTLFLFIYSYLEFKKIN